MKHLFGSLVLWFSLAAVPAFAADEEFQMKFFDLTEGQVAFTYVRGENRDIYVTDFGTLETRPLIATPAKEENPEFSPNGKKLAYQSEVKGLMQIFVADADGTHPIRINYGPGPNESPSWSPDGKQIVFQSSHPSDADLVLVNADGTKPVPILKNGKRNLTPRFSPRGDEVLFASNQEWPGWDIFLLDLTTKRASVLTKGDGSFLIPAWHPFGGGLAFAHGDGQRVGLWYGERGSPIGSPLTAAGVKYSDPSWSSTGQFLFAVREATPGKADYQLVVAKIETKDSARPGLLEFNPVVISTGVVRHPSFTSFSSLDALAKKLSRKRTPSSSSSPTNQ